MSYLIREAREGDVASILNLIKELAVFEKAPNEVEIDERILSEDLFGTKKIIECLVAEIDSEAVGIAVFYTKYSTWKGKCIYLEDIVVTEAKRSLGIGKALFKAVMKVAKERDSGRMEWQVLDWNTSAIDFYKSFGAILDGEWINGKFNKQQLKDFNY